MNYFSSLKILLPLASILADESSAPCSDSLPYKQPVSSLWYFFLYFVCLFVYIFEHLEIVSNIKKISTIKIVLKILTCVYLDSSTLNCLIQLLYCLFPLHTHTFTHIQLHICARNFFLNHLRTSHAYNALYP